MGPRAGQARELVEFLCSDECAGRGPGTEGSVLARERIVAELEAAGVEPAGNKGYLQKIPGPGTNVLGAVPGRGALGARAILVAAHYDHLGTWGGDIYRGADDNAAAVAVLLDLARELVGDPQPPESARQVVLASFDCEEPPYFTTRNMGSMHYVAHPPTVPIDRFDAMVCMDLVGHAVGPPAFPTEVRQCLFVLGAEMSEGTPALVDAVAARATGVIPRRLALDVIPPLSDYYAFVQACVPPIFLSCGRWEHYHRPTDTPDKLDYDKVAATARFLFDLVGALRARPEVPVRFLRGGRDDAATVASLSALAEGLAPHLPLALQVKPLLCHLAAVAAEGDLSRAERQLLERLVEGLESVLT